MNKYHHQDKVEQYNSQLTEFIKTINELKLRKDSIMAYDAAQKAKQIQAQHDIKLLNQQKEMLEKQYHDSLMIRQ